MTLSVGAFGTQSNTITVTAFNASGVQVAQAQASAPGGTFRTQLSLSVASATIRFVRVRGSTLGTFGIDSLFISDQPTTGPTSRSACRSARTWSSRGRPINVPVTLTRRNSSGTIRISATRPAERRERHAGGPHAGHGLGAGVDDDAQPAADRRVERRRRAGHDGDRHRDAADQAAGSGTRSLTIQVRVLVLYDLRVIGVEPTQGIQSRRLRVRHRRPRARATPACRCSTSAARSCASTRTRGAAGFPVSLRRRCACAASRVGRRAAGQPALRRQRHPHGAVQHEPAAVVHRALDRGRALHLHAAAELDRRAGRARRSRPSSPGCAPSCSCRTQGVSFRECDGCAGNDAHGRSPTSATRRPAASRRRRRSSPRRAGRRPRPIDQILAPGLNLIPLQIDLKPYGTTLDLTSALERNADGNLVINRDQAVDRLLAFNQRDGGGEIVLGILSPEFSDGFGALPYGIFDDLPDRPFTSSAHELGHALGRPHASRACGGERRGLAARRDRAHPGLRARSPRRLAVPRLRHAARARSSRRRRAATTAGVLRPHVLLRGRRRRRPERVDLRQGLDGLHQPLAQRRAAVGRGARASGGGAGRAGALQVNASVDAAGAVAILSVRPLAPKPQPGLADTPFRLVVRDAAGAVLADVPMQRPHVRDRPRRRAAARCSRRRRRSTRPPRRASRSSRDGGVLARRARSAERAHGRVPEPAQGAARRPRREAEHPLARVRPRRRPAGGDRRVVVARRAAGHVADRLARAQRRHGRAAQRLLRGLGRGGLRLRVNDGFNETVVLSPPFRTIHRRPVVQIVNPRPGTRLARGAPIALQARALDERQQEIASRRVRWFDGRRRIARGDRAAVRLRAGVHRLRARGAGHGRRSWTPGRRGPEGRPGLRHRGRRGLLRPRPARPGRPGHAVHHRPGAPARSRCGFVQSSCSS